MLSSHWAHVHERTPETSDRRPHQAPLLGSARKCLQPQQEVGRFAGATTRCNAICHRPPRIDASDSKSRAGALLNNASSFTKPWSAAEKRMHLLGSSCFGAQTAFSPL